MRVVFFDDAESDTLLWEADLSDIPRLGDMVSLHSGDDYPKVGRVDSVEWCIYKSGSSHVEVVLYLM